MRPPVLLGLILSFLSFAIADESNPTAYDTDPYLKYRPPFVRSLPVQILLTGIVLALVVVLFIHLLFTAQYHWPLAPINYALQLSAVVTLLITLIATLHVVLAATMIESQRWPYMLSYIAVNVPPLDVETSTLNYWSIAERATWLVMNASTSALIQITHIHFLTFLYPSRLEGRLIFILLGPLAILAAVLILVQGLADPSTAVAIACAVRNVCNAALSLLFTIALFIWGFFVNRRQAWRTDGGTAVFGTAALSLALISTALNFLYIDREEEYVWLPSLMWAVVLWQSFLGWWWWVGAGSGGSLLGASEMEARLKRQEKRELKRREAKERRDATKTRARKVLKDMTGVFGDIHTSVTGTSPQVTTGRRRRGRHIETPISAGEHNDQEVTDVEDETSQNTPERNNSTRVFPRFVCNWYASLRLAHREAARAQEVERVERIRGLGRQHPIRKGGWALGSFCWKGAAASSSHTKTRGWRTDDEIEMGGSSSKLSLSSLRRTRSDATLHSRSEKGEPIQYAPPPAVPSPVQSSSLDQQRRSVWWWGPLRRWRLQDTTIY